MVDLYSGFDLFGRFLDVSALRARMIAHNVANQNTPGYRRKDVRFEEFLSRAIDQGGGPRLFSVSPEVFEPAGGVVKPDGNNVVLEDEIAENVKNEILFQVVNEALRWRFGLYREALQER